MSSNSVAAAVAADLPVPSVRPATGRAARISRAAVLCGYAAALYAVLLPFPPHGAGLQAPIGAVERLTLALVWVAFMLRVFQVHLGVGLLALLLPAAWGRRWRTVLAGLPLVAYALWPLLADLAPKRPPAIVGTPLRVLTANLYQSNRDVAAAVQQIRESDADLVALQEYAAHTDAALTAALADSHPYVVRDPRTNHFGIALFSRLPFVEPPRSDIRLGTIATPRIRAVVEHQGRPIVVYVVHTFPAEGLDGLSEMNAGFGDLLAAVRAESGPLIVCGDFNAPRHTQPMAPFAALNLRSSHELAGFGLGATWPDLGPLRNVPFVQIDHILLSRELTASASHVLPGRGSDHRMVLATIGLAR